MDGKLTDRRTPFLFEMDGIKNYPKIKFELHFMGLYPEIYIEEFKNLNLKKILIHYEAYEFDSEVLRAIKKLKEEGFEVGLVLNPDTSLEILDQFIDEIYSVMLMGVKPGSQGQTIDSKLLSRVSTLKEKYSELLIKVDGGIRLENIKEISNAGCNYLCVGSAINSQENPEKEYKKFVKEVK